MLQPTNKFTTHLKSTGGCLLTLFVLIFVFSITTLAFMEVLQDTKSAESNKKAQENEINEENEVNATVVRVLMSANDQRVSANGENVRKFLLVNIERENDTETLLTTTIKEQKQQLQHQQYKRDVGNTADNQNNSNQSTVKQGYYEEQQPVLVHAETLPTLGAPPSAYQDTYYARPGSVYDDEEEDDSQESADGYPYEQRPAAGYYGDDNDDRNAGEERVGGEAESVRGEMESVGEGRAAGNSAYDSYYRQWHYATPAPVQRPNGGWEVGGNRQLQNAERDPYAAYDADGPMEDYEYPGALTPLQKQQYEQQLLKRQQLQPRPQNRPQQTTIIEQQQQAVQGADLHNRPSTTSNNNSSNNNSPTENSLLSTLKSLKTMWDIYQAFAAAWNTLATHRERQEQQQQEAAKRRQQQIAQQTRINSKKPPKIGANDKYTQRNSSSSAESSEVTGGAAPNAAKRVKPNNRTTKNPKTTTKTTTTTQSTTSTEFVASSEVEETVANSSSSGNKRNNGSNGHTMARQNAQGSREKRQTTDTAVSESTDVGEGRYIKGDPLKGYYDFVITEGSYKFWAVFQTGTALLIIYSTFAAIYYSKVNPLVSDYDYTDYLGGARSLTGGDDDFIDDDNDGEGAGKKARRSSWLDAMLPRAGRTIKYVLDALDKLPVDHREADEAMRNERARVATTNGQAIGEDDATGNAYENGKDDGDATRQTGKEVGSETTPEEMETTQRQVRAYAA
ncbi:uncharacterized protein [Bactrocera oleae]|uniref:uncharacterized protein n=1 Tax=Bactrocera oleae TaxID=104688 RepID=UPI00387E6CA9